MKFSAIFISNKVYSSPLKDFTDCKNVYFHQAIVTIVKTDTQYASG